MTDLLWPGDERAGDSFAAEAFWRAMVDVESAWLQALRPGDRSALAERVSEDDLGSVARAAEASGNPVVPLVALLRSRLQDDDPVAARWLHRGLTSQDVVDTALVLCARSTTSRVLAHLEDLTDSLAQLAARHRDDVMVGRTLTQHAVPTTFGLKVAGWLHGVLDARDDLLRLHFPVQVGGAAGTLAAAVELAGDPVAARDLVAATATTLGLDPAPPWHTVRTPLTRYADALVRTTDALGHVARDVLVLARPEVGEVAEPAADGRGGSSTMPHKRNPVLSVLVRRAALAGPGLAAQLHLAAGEAVDERPDGGWHVEWATLSQLSRRTLVGASQAAELVAGLHVDTARMAERAEAAAPDLLAERTGIRAVRDERPPDREQDRDHDHEQDPRSYLGAAAALVHEVLERAHAVDEEDS
ncbi:lyase family protein [Nocardioides aequoreus]|uniref:lyase family protein n=1 Tax=Nocardioides aequoreus TaxID=397278 RepID=UPI0004C420E8|nr:lyase family protein [Nocardioides aequoreus]